jgi:hypothetical protein
MAKKKVAKRATAKRAQKARAISTVIAHEFLADPSAVALSRFNTIDDAAAGVLAASDESLCLGGLTHLSDAAAQGLATYKGRCLELYGLTEVSDETARFLAKVRSVVNLNGVKHLSDEAKRHFTKPAGQVYLTTAWRETVSEIVGAKAKRGEQLVPSEIAATLQKQGINFPVPAVINVLKSMDRKKRDRR